jgi:DNA-binding response OmpR family regulator
MEYTFLLIGEKMESMWPLILEQALLPLGPLRLVSEQVALWAISEDDYDVIIIDSGAVDDPVGLVSHLRERRPETRIIVATASPTWQRARDVLQAGADDYIRKSLDKEQLQTKIRAVVEASAQPDSR